jgi:predicted dehydrogenase
VYPVTLATLVLGPADQIEALTLPAQTGVDAYTEILLNYPSAATAQLSCGLLAASPCTARISGSDGYIELDTPFYRPARLTLRRKHADPQVIARPFDGHGYTHQAAEVAACLHAGLAESPVLPHSATMEVMRLLDRIRRAGAHP